MTLISSPIHGRTGKSSLVDDDDSPVMDIVTNQTGLCYRQGGRTGSLFFHFSLPLWFCSAPSSLIHNDDNSTCHYVESIGPIRLRYVSAVQMQRLTGFAFPFIIKSFFFSFNLRRSDIHQHFRRFFCIFGPPSYVIERARSTVIFPSLPVLCRDGV